MQTMVFSFMFGRRPCLPARHAVPFTFRVKVSHRMNPLNAIACMRLSRLPFDKSLSLGHIIFMMRINIFCFVVLLFAQSLLVARCPAAREVNGRVTTVHGLRVLQVWGTHYEMGYAHGYLLADDIVRLLEEYMLAKLLDVEHYDTTRQLLHIYTHIPPVYWLELQGMYDGMRDALGDEGLYSATLETVFQPLDLFAWNMIPEIFRLYFSSRDDVHVCSSISGWGAGTPDGNLVFARNLEFGSPGDLLEQQALIIAYRPSTPLQHDWVSFAWPGYIGCLSGMNEVGVGSALNLGNAQPELDELLLPLDGLYIGIPFFYGSISLTLRQAIEQWPLLCRWGNPVEHVYRLVQRQPVAGSFDIHVTAPFRLTTVTGGIPAGIVECTNAGTVLRTAADNSAAAPVLVPRHFLAVTNHHRKLIKPIACSRYEKLVELLNGAKALSIDTALGFEREVAQRNAPFNIAYRVGWMPDLREFWVCFSDSNVSAADVVPVHITWDELMK